MSADMFPDLIACTPWCDGNHAAEWDICLLRGEVCDLMSTCEHSVDFVVFQDGGALEVLVDRFTYCGKDSQGWTSHVSEPRIRFGDRWATPEQARTLAAVLVDAARVAESN